MTFEQQPQDLRQRVKQLAEAAIAQAQPTAWFEKLYAAAQGNPDQVPWAKLDMHPHIRDWLTRQAVLEEQQAALVVGCGLGDDAEALQALGFQVTAFDIAPTAIAWCHQRFPDSSVDYQVGDLLAPNSAWVGAFDLVVECRDIQALPLSLRGKAIASVASLVAPGGRLLVVTRLRQTEAEPEGPPWPLSEGELAAFGTAGLAEIQRSEFVSEDPTVHEAWIEYRRQQ